MIKLIKGECLEVMDKLIAEGIKVDAIITDPPYGTTACKWDSVIPFDEMWPRLKALRKERTPIVLFGSEPFSSELRMSNIKEYKYDWIWKKSRKTGFQMVRYRPMKDYELISVFYKKQPLYKNTELVELSKPVKSWRKNGKGGDLLTPVNTIPKDRKQQFTGFNTTTLVFSNEHNVGDSCHPTQKPIKLMEYLIKTYTNEGDLILDFTCGSGSTGVAANKLNRSFIGIDNGIREKKNSKYYGLPWVEVARDRIEGCQV